MSVLSIVGGSQTYSSASGGKVYPYNAITNAGLTQVAPPNTQRQKITFHNPGANDIFIAPSVAANPTTGALTTFTPTLAALGGCFRVFGNGGTLEISGECATGWQAIAAAGTTNPLTVMDSNVG